MKKILVFAVLGCLSLSGIILLAACKKDAGANFMPMG